MKRYFDLVLSIILIIVLFIPMVIIAILVRINSKGPALYWSERIGKDNVNFQMPKFRSMIKNTNPVPTHLMKNPDKYLTTFGRFIRKTSLDELPQLYSVFKGDMSFVGPRPALFNQNDLQGLRTKKGVHELYPGITGWAQVNGRDEVSIYKKVMLDAEYIDKKSFWFDIKILWLTFKKVFSKSGVTH